MIKNLKIILFAVCVFVTATFIVVLGIEYIGACLKRYNTVYTYLGDSISAGYALPNYKEDGIEVAESFPFKFGEKINAVKTNNLAVSGARTEDLFELLKTEKYAKCVKNSDVITLSIGSNDILKPGLSVMFDSVDAKNEDEFLKKISDAKKDRFKLFAILSVATASVSEPEATEVLSKSIKTFKMNFIEIIGEMRAMNKNAIIIVENFYNPYRDIVYENAGIKIIDFGDCVQKYIDEMNEFLCENKYYDKEYFVSDISDIGDGRTNVRVDIEKSEFCVDPHPNEEGHEYIYRQTLKAYREAEKKFEF